MEKENIKVSRKIELFPDEGQIKILNKFFGAHRYFYNKAIDNYLHSREVDLSASFLLLFNIIEIFNIKQEIEKFDFNKSKDENFNKILIIYLKNF